jgi:hypothetical protein
MINFQTMFNFHFLTLKGKIKGKEEKMRVHGLERNAAQNTLFIGSLKAHPCPR